MMKAVLMKDFKEDLVVTEMEKPELTDDGVVIQIKANGICRSDYHIWQGDWAGLSAPLVMGHEFTGVIQEVGKNVKKFKKGDRVIVPFSLSCGTCEYCLDGDGNICEERQAAGITFNGGYAEYAHVPLADINLAHLPEEIDFVAGAAMGCRFATSFHGIVNRAKVKAGEWVVVSGCGGVGLSALQFSLVSGANVICVDIDEEKLKLAKKLGANHVINSTKENVPETVREIIGGGADVTVDALGHPAIFEDSLNSLHKKGRHLQIGIPADEVEFKLQVRNLVNYEQQIIGTRGLPPQKFPQMLNVVKSNKLNPGDLVTKKIKPEEVNEALKSMGTYDNTGITVLEW